MRRIRIWCILCILLAGVCGCGEQTTEKEFKTSSVETMINIVAEVEQEVAETETNKMNVDQKEAYRILVEGCSDPDAVYYLVDLTGDGSLELLLGNGFMTVYSYNRNMVTTIGSLKIDKAYLSDTYGMIAVVNGDTDSELRQYQYDGEMFKERILDSAKDETVLLSKVKGMLTSPLTPIPVSDREFFQ